MQRDIEKVIYVEPLWYAGVFIFMQPAQTIQGRHI